MTYIRELKGWPQFIWDSAALAAELGAVRHRQGKHLGRMEALGFELRTEASLESLTSEVVNSWAIEGEVLDSDEVRSSIASRLGLETAGLPTVGREVDGVVTMMLDATRNFREPLTAERLFNWHGALFPTGRNALGKLVVGDWRTAEAGAMQVVSGAIGKPRIHFEAPTASRLESEMKAFLEWINSLSPIDPVLKAGIAHLWFLTIHPFEDGNGRIARAICDLALSRADGVEDRFCSLSAQIEVERKQYYEQLESSQSGSLDITAWLHWFLGCLDRAIARADETLASVLHKAHVWDRLHRHPVNERQRTVLNRLLDGFDGHLSTSKYAKLAKCSTDTALRDMQDLFNRGVLVRNPGGGRSTSYRLADPDSIRKE